MTPTFPPTASPVSSPVVEIEVIEDFSASARCDEGFLQVRRLRCHNVRADGTHSKVYRVDVVDRPRLDAVAVLVHRRGAGGAREVLTRMNLRPAAYFRRDKTPAVADPAPYLRVEEIVAGLLEPEDRGEAGVRARAAAEVWEEGGYRVAPEAVQLLGAPFFVAPGILSEKIFLAAVDVTGLEGAPPPGDGSPLEEGGELRWRPLPELLAACRAGEVPDAKTELALTRLVALEGAAARAP
ncbi:NUDIX hydrolase [Aggregicoccus sp. 17bor-14]|uniref:NUDIX hydrolase n=1 Tax=Myxococcaceae TaxID=31 RepID=UPI00129D000D|nr:MULTISPECIES: NUDIX hydrolase [Myxococcaceae]MBF5041430.1 NUDIX hydrolase [Simulacricoccus sp. 17bor-14]MRI87214.1 NUDIX hydrolase [Aggregicoccus sp. 17bor-14]